MSRWSVYAHFKGEISSGRAKRMLANAVRLDQAADKGSVPAMKYLHSLMMAHGAQAETDDDWADVVGPISAQKRESQDLN